MPLNVVGKFTKAQFNFFELRMENKETILGKHTVSVIEKYVNKNEVNHFRNSRTISWKDVTAWINLVCKQVYLFSFKRYTWKNNNSHTACYCKRSGTMRHNSFIRNNLKKTDHESGTSRGGKNTSKLIRCLKMRKMKCIFKQKSFNCDYGINRHPTSKIFIILTLTADLTVFNRCDFCWLCYLAKN